MPRVRRVSRWLIKHLPFVLCKLKKWRNPSIGRVLKVTMKIRFSLKARHFILLTLTFNSC